MPFPQGADPKLQFDKTLRALRRPPLGKYIDPSGDVSKEGTSFLHEIVDQHQRVIAWIIRAADSKWQIQLFTNGRPGDSTGDYGTVEGALAVVQKEADECA